MYRKMHVFFQVDSQSHEAQFNLYSYKPLEGSIVKPMSEQSKFDSSWTFLDKTFQNKEIYYVL